ncbi:MAG: GTP-binding protein [Candidatus Lokiarchaeota archaeon]|nr:GTP-binding protein [Candidatus Lokiarchaeota archaeon]
MAESDFTFKIVLVGDESEGKSYFARSFCYNLFSADSGITIGVAFFVRMINILGKSIKFQIWDMAAEERFRFLVPTYCKGASGGIIVYDINKANSLKHILENIQIIRKEAGNVPIVIIGTKCVEEDQEDSRQQEIQRDKSEDMQNTEEIFENLAENLIEGVSQNIIIVPKPIELKRRLYREKWPEFRINDYLALKLENNKTNIYVGEKLFNHCKYLLLNIDRNNFKEYDELESIDEAAERLDDRMHGIRFQKYHISPETEFWGHCSNIQAWYENEYDTRILHRNLAFSLLEALIKAGDPLAEKVMKEEIAHRLESGYPSVVMYLIKQNYLKYLTQEELNTIFENPNFQKNLSKWFKDSTLIPKWLSKKIKFKLKNQNLWK